MTASYFLLAAVVALLINLASTTSYVTSSPVKLGNELLRADNYAVLRGHRVIITLKYRLNFCLLSSLSFTHFNTNSPFFVDALCFV